MPFQPTLSTSGRAVQNGEARDIHRTLPEEVPVAIVFNGSTLAVMMATPQNIADFAYGFAWTEGAVTDPSQIERFEIVEHDTGIEARFWLCQDRADTLAARRRAMAGPVGCGLCGIDSLDQALRSVPRVQSDVVLPASEVATATDQLRAHQPLHDQTRAVHAAGLLLPGQGIVLAREDVGRHNALDKLIGAARGGSFDLSRAAIVMTSRVSVELVQKAAMAGCPILIAVSAPTVQALRLADTAGVTVAAFARGGGFDVYSHPYRILDEVPHVA